MTGPAARTGPARRALDARAYALMVLLCLVWACQQVAIKWTAPDMPPVFQLAVRFAGAALIYAGLVAASEGRNALRDGTLQAGLQVGALFALEFLLVAEGLKYTTAAHAVVFLYTAPVFSALGLQILPEERLAPVQWAGIALALLGISVALLDQRQQTGSLSYVGDGLCLAAGAMWGASTVVLRRSRLAGAAAIKTVAYQVTMGALLLGAYTFVSGQTDLVVTPRLVFNLVFQTVGIAFLSYLGWFWLLRVYLTSRLMLLALMTPLFGVVLGALLMGDPVDARFTLGTVLVLCGIAIVNGAELLSLRR